jgi:hypothetical protein
VTLDRTFEYDAAYGQKTRPRGKAGGTGCWQRDQTAEAVRKSSLPSDGTGAGTVNIANQDKALPSLELFEPESGSTTYNREIHQTRERGGGLHQRVVSRTSLFAWFAWFAVNYLFRFQPGATGIGHVP